MAKDSKTPKSLDARIAAVLSANGEADRSTLTSLLNEATEALAAAEETVRIETERILEITNPDPEEADAKVRVAERTVKRLTAAIPRLNERLEQIGRADVIATWNADHERLRTETEALAAEFRAAVPNPTLPTD